METMVKVEKLRREFGDFVAVNDLDFEVRRGEIFGFLGPNGAGKSTTIKMLCGLLAPTSGAGTVAGCDIMREQELIKTRIGYMSQRFSLYDDLTVLENMRFFGGVYGLDGRALENAVDAALDIVDLRSEKKSMVRHLPGGIKQRLALAASVVHNPPMLFLDEPTSGVDPMMRRVFWDLIYRFSEEGRTVFVTTHYMDEAGHCGRIALIIAGQLVALDSPAALRENLDYDVWQIQSSDFMNLFEKLASLEQAAEVALFGSDIHVIAKKGTDIKETVKKLVGGEKKSHYTITRGMPSLEDVFVMRSRERGL